MAPCKQLAVLLFALAATAGVSTAGAATPGSGTRAPERVTVYSAGSLRGIVDALAAQVARKYDIKLVPTFGGSGALRTRIEHGSHADLLLSADLHSPQRLQAEHRTTLPALLFARNRICIVAPRADGVTAGNFVSRVLAPTTRIWTSTPVVDPGGDYAATILGKIAARHPAARATLEARAKAVREATAKAPGNGLAKFAGLFARRQIDMLVTYCSVVPALERKAPELASFVIPPQLDPHPLDGMAVLSDRPAVLRVALYLMSTAGQAIVAKNHLVPVSGP